MFGWGDRLPGFIVEKLLNIMLVLDPNTNNHPNYKKQVEFYKNIKRFFESPKKVDMIC